MYGTNVQCCTPEALAKGSGRASSRRRNRATGSGPAPSGKRASGKAGPRTGWTGWPAGSRADGQTRKPPSPLALTPVSRPPDPRRHGPASLFCPVPLYRPSPSSRAARPAASSPRHLLQCPLSDPLAAIAAPALLGARSLLGPRRPQSGPPPPVTLRRILAPPSPSSARWQRPAGDKGDTTCLESPPRSRRRQPVAAKENIRRLPPGPHTLLAPFSLHARLGPPLLGTDASPIRAQHAAVANPPGLIECPPNLETWRPQARISVMSGPMLRPRALPSVIPVRWANTYCRGNQCDWLLASWSYARLPQPVNQAPIMDHGRVSRLPQSVS